MLRIHSVVIYWTNCCNWIQNLESMRMQHWITISFGPIRCRAIWAKCCRIICKVCLSILHHHVERATWCATINKWMPVKCKTGHKTIAIRIVFIRYVVRDFPFNKFGIREFTRSHVQLNSNQAKHKRHTFNGLYR